MSYLPSKTMGCFSGRLMSAASDQKLFCKLCSLFCCSFDEFEEKVISPTYSSAILTPPLLSFSFLPFTSLLCSDICKASSDNHFAFFHFFFFRMVLFTTSCAVLQTSAHSSLILCLPDLIPCITSIIKS